MFYRITFSNRDAVAESEDGRYWYIRTSYNTHQVPIDNGYYITPFGKSRLIEDVLAWNGYSIKTISVVFGENIFGFKVAEGSPRRWEVIKREGDNRSVIGHIYETGEPGSAYRFEPTDKKKKELRGNSLVWLLIKLKPRGWT